MENLENKTKEQLLKEIDQLKTKVVELEKSELKNRIWLENSPVCTKIVDLDFNLQYMSSSGVRELKIDDITEFYGKPYPLHFYPDSFKIPMTKNLKKAKETGETITQEAPIVDIKGNTLWYHSTIVPVYNDKGQLDYLMVVSLETTERKQTEERLIESEGKFKSLIEQAGDAMFLSDYDGNIIAVNNNSCESLGYSREELLSMKVGELDAIYIEPEKMKTLWNTLVSGKSQTIETIHKRKDGVLFPVEIRIGVIETEGKKTILGIARDITERKKAEQLLKDSEYLLRESQKIAVLGSYILDITNGIWNSSLVLDDIFGINKKYIKNIDTWVKFVHTDDRDMIQDYFATNVLTNHETFDKVYRIKRINDKQVRWVHGLGELEFDDDGNPIKMMGTIQDITERKQVEDTLATHRQRLTYILEGTNAGTWDWNIPSGECVFNDRWAEIMGYSLKELEPIDINTWINNVHPDDLPKANEMLNKVFNKELDYFDVVFRQPHKDGSWIWVNARGKVVDWSEEGKPLRISGTHLDITKQMQAQEELKKNRDHLEQLVKERTAEVDEKNKKLSDQMKVFVGRELTIRNLENRIKALGGK